MKKFLKHIRPELKKNKWYLISMILIMILVNILEAIYPFIYKNLANGFAEGIEKSEQISQGIFHLINVYAIIWTAWRGFEYSIVKLEVKAMASIEKRCFDAMQNKSMRFFENSFAGSLVKKAGRFVRAFEGVADWFYFHFINKAMQIVITLSVFFWVAPQLAFLFLAWIIVFIGGNVWFSIWKMKFDFAVAEQDSIVGGQYADALSNIFTVKSYAKEYAEYKKISLSVDDLKQKRYWTRFLSNINYAVQALLMIATEIVSIYILFLGWQKGQYNIGDFVFFQTFILLLFHRLWDFGHTLQDFFRSLADAEEMIEIFEGQKEIIEKENAKTLLVKKGEIEWKNITFAYEEEKTQFKNLDLKIKAGEKVAFVGESGGGKSTMIKLLFRFFDVQSGGVLIDNQNVKDLTLKSLRRAISIVPQEAQLFHRTLEENIAFAKNDVNKEEVKKVAKQANCDFIHKMPKKFDTIVGERGVKLSGGEKQRIALARSFLKNAPIVVLDEATSALDSITESKIQKAMFRLLKGRTAIVIAHRLSTIQKMDRIVVFKNGNIIESGIHAELINKKGEYAKMWQKQTGGYIGGDFDKVF